MLAASFVEVADVLASLFPIQLNHIMTGSVCQSKDLHTLQSAHPEQTPKPQGQRDKEMSPTLVHP